MQFLAQPLCFFLGIPVAMWILGYFFPRWSDFILFVGLMLMIPAAAFLAVQVLDYLSGGVSFEGGYYTLRYSDSFYLRTVIIPAGAVALVELRQSFFQRFGGKCDLFIHTRSEGKEIHRCRGLKLSEMQALFLLNSPFVPRKIGN